jgi:hypothetical protein
MKKLLYIVGCTHGGTTLLHRLLGSQPPIINLGSVANLRRVAAKNASKNCSCGLSVRECSFWTGIETSLHNKTGRKLHDLNVNSRDPGIFATDNLQFLNAVSDASGKEFIVDSSRTAWRLQQLHKALGPDKVVPIHIFRTPEAQINSWTRKNAKRESFIKNNINPYSPKLILWYYRAHITGLHAAKRIEQRLVIDYESLCENPARALEPLLELLGQSLDQAKLANWGTVPHHVLGGNRMLRNATSEIRLDDGWKSELSPSRAILVRSACMPIYQYLRRASSNSGRKIQN